MLFEQTPLRTVARPLEPAPIGSAEAKGLPDAFLVELLLRHFSRMGELRLFEISQRLALSASRIETLLTHMRTLKLVEVPRRGAMEGDVSYALTELGHTQAKLASEKCQYVGPAPVTLDEYVSMVRDQSLRLHPTTVQRLKVAMGNLVIDEEMLPSLGSALNSGRAIYLYGPSGSGKTYLAEHLVKTLQGHIWVPHAIYVDSEVIQVFDPMVHRAVEESTLTERSLSRDAAPDGRWVRIERPVVITGGELTLQMLELEFDNLSHVYVAPPQMKANNGIFVIDDLGRQRISPRELLNRWIGPLDRHVDYLSLHTGGKFEVPFDVTVIFSSNLTPDELTDAAFARRLGYKILIGALSQTGYREVIAQACQRVGMEFDTEVVDFMIDHLHPSYEQAYLPCIPYDVISKIRDRARYLGQVPRLTPELIEWAWKMYFGAGDQPQRQVVRNHETEEAKK
ncbi:MAG: ATP-binding protein [Rhodoferax sp.]|uniref:ATP-binding protein n=1 Tax=Rhodoferax sp. TaxID=50421 RepID=UPI0018523645|nr:ATP-binding protein [Rhodoferax sp.]NMM20019.1 ATP-binding protein [Rhodoferax sp.]